MTSQQDEPNASSAPAEAAPVLVLVGPPGAGKSTVGALLASRWGVELRDTDSDIEARVGKSVAEIFFDEGEGRFRELEREAVDEALEAHHGVLALGGGAVLSETTRQRLRSHRVVFLDVGLADAASRVGLGATRPLLLGNVRSQLKALLDARRPLYTQVATSTVQTDGRSAADVADEVANAVTHSEADGGVAPLGTDDDKPPEETIYGERSPDG